MLSRYENKMAQATHVPLRCHETRVRHGIDFVEVCDGNHDRSAPCRYREATDAERADFSHAKLVIP